MDSDRSDCVKVLEYLVESRSERMDVETEFRRPFTTVIVSVKRGGGSGIGLGGWAVGIGIAKCNGEDTFSPWEGHEIAKKRAFRSIADDPDSRKIVLDIGESLIDVTELEWREQNGF